jgi:hypothetical protein
MPLVLRSARGDERQKWVISVAAASRRQPLTRQVWLESRRESNGLVRTRRMLVLLSK